MVSTIERPVIMENEDRQPCLGPRLRLAEAAWYLGISPKSLADRGWRRKHGIPAIKIGRAVVFDRSDLDRWLARHRERLMREERGLLAP